jgi:predicted dehydrogenase
MIRQMRDMVAAGALGKLRHVQVEYAQDWLTEAAESTGAKGAEWRTDPSRSAAGGSIGDIGTHAFNLAAFVTGETPDRLLADLTSFVPGRRLDDSANILLRYASCAKGMLWASQVAIGNENTLTLPMATRRGLSGARDAQPGELHALWRIDVDHHPQRGRQRPIRGSRQPRAGGASGRLPWGICNHL